MQKTTVVNVRKEKCDIYIGRLVKNARYNFSHSPFGNPFKPEAHGSVEECLARYKRHVLNDPKLMSLLPSLKGKKLGCWCKPSPCHGDVLVELIEEYCKD